jgi:hypothetical protein
MRTCTIGTSMLRKRVTGNSPKLRLGDARGLLALVVSAFGQVSGDAQGFGAFEGVVGLKQPGLCRDDTAPDLGAREGGVVLSKLGFERVGDKPDEDVALFHARALFTRVPSSASTSVTRKPSTSGPTRTSSRATSEPVTSTVSLQRAARACTHHERVNDVLRPSVAGSAPSPAASGGNRE